MQERNPFVTFPDILNKCTDMYWRVYEIYSMGLPCLIERLTLQNNNIFIFLLVRAIRCNIIAYASDQVRYYELYSTSDMLNKDTSNGSWCMGIKGEMSGTVCVTFTWYMFIYELFIAFVCFVVCSLLLRHSLWHYMNLVNLNLNLNPLPMTPGQPPPGRDPNSDT